MTTLDYARITVGPMQKVFVNLALVKYEYDPVVGFCVDEPDKLAYTRDGLTSVLLCKQECHRNITIKYCGCAPVMANVISTKETFCNPQKALQCFLSPKSVMKSQQYRTEVFWCQQNRCPKLCKTTMHVPFATYSTIKTPIPTENSVVNIYFGELAFTLARYFRITLCNKTSELNFL